MEEKILNENNETPKDPLTKKPQKKERLVTGSKAGDFMRGIGLALLYFGLTYLSWSLGIFFIYFIAIISYPVISIIMLVKEKNYLAFGFLSLLLVPLFLYGGCIVLITTGR